MKSQPIPAIQGEIPNLNTTPLHYTIYEELEEVSLSGIQKNGPQEQQLETNDQKPPEMPDDQKPPQTPDDQKPPEAPDDQKPPNDDVPNETIRAATLQVPGSHAERMLAMLVPAIEKVIENVDDKKQSRVLDELRNFANPSRWVYRTVVLFLGATALVTVGGIVWLGLCGKAAEIPDGLIALGSASIGALAGLLANRSN